MTADRGRYFPDYRFHPFMPRACRGARLFFRQQHQLAEECLRLEGNLRRGDLGQRISGGDERHDAPGGNERDQAGELSARAQRRADHLQVLEIERASRKKAIEQLKIYAMRAGANAITNWACVFDAVDWTNNCWNSVECQADAIQVD